ncbi:CRISPR-associated endonuclease Cas1 [Parabacteroides acidifaciens]|uniref:CRISPR-associated endonuclease Cas1 n=1 Tax=Parabacteroides acidifaciens TaxID=2290935 RepID=A0A3D8HC39_9BACT|nr:CRISPR-associated endonuclease Cas1 [Parabacteroides acidifaciens]MBC8602936.1 CRISPR-associated endonuclease Cas1 [Parabacteroides acidifaciens]RDU48340.1 CRISPR-associated endonuclease Cas1 [Parabacteroides acidifaciens]
METQKSCYSTLCTEAFLFEAWKAVKSKNASGGIDGVTLACFEDNVQTYISELSGELRAGIWSPEPYLSIEIPKKKNEVRKLGLLSVKDKIVQYAIKTLVEPLFENIFVDASYGYRPNKGHTKAVRRALNECQKKKNKWVLKLDIDNYFDTINHHLLAARLHALIPDEEIVRLIMLSVQMGVVNKHLKWNDSLEGVPQGAILSPLLANFYLHPFDKFVQTLCRSYVRYADDFCLMCETHEQAKVLLNQLSVYLQTHLGLTLNTPIVADLRKGCEFLGITISKGGLSLSEKKEADLKERIANLSITNKGFTSVSLRAWNGVRNYYGALLPQSVLHALDDLLYDRMKQIVIASFQQIANRAVLIRIMSEVDYLSNEYQLYKKRMLQDYVELYDLQKGKEKEKRAKEQNKKIIEQRKAEYRKREGEGSELLINTFGCFVGLSGKGVTVKRQGKVIHQKPLGALSHITISSKGVTLSSNLIDYCLANKITIDFFNSSGWHTGSILSNKYIENTLWNKQAQCGKEKRLSLATCIIEAKLKNQFYLVKYYHKYHKHCYDTLSEKYEDLSVFNVQFKTFVRGQDKMDEEFLIQLVGQESQGAIKYWGYIRELLSDDKVGFVKRERKGATDLVNCMLNYGYAILYTRVWQALLGAKLNPFDSIIHVRQSGKPTFVYDVVEMFRSQVVDRVVISLIQKGPSLRVEKGLLEEETKKLLIKSILERLNRYEKYRGEEITMEQIIRRQACEMAAWIDEGKKYKPYIAKW